MSNRNLDTPQAVNEATRHERKDGEQNKARRKDTKPAHETGT